MQKFPLMPDERTLNIESKRYHLMSNIDKQEVTKSGDGVRGVSKIATKVSEDDATNDDDVKRRMKPQLSSGSRKVLWRDLRSREVLKAGRHPKRMMRLTIAILCGMRCRILNLLQWVTMRWLEYG